MTEESKGEAAEAALEAANRAAASSAAPPALVALSTSLAHAAGTRCTTLRRHYVTTPICCPSRTTTLSGRYFHNQREPSPTRGGCMHTTIKELDANGLPSWNK